jgi:intracellular multiplication protein IcmL
MAVTNVKKYFYALMALMVVMLAALAVILYQVSYRPLPAFYAEQASGEKMQLSTFDEPNLLPETIIRWAIRATVTAYTFNFAYYKDQIALARPYFTADGWQGYLTSIDSTLTNIISNQLYVNSVVVGTPVISNQGPLPGKGYSWRVQIPLLVTYQTGEVDVVSKRNFYVILTIVRVPTSTNPQGIGIDQFVMV